MARDLHTCFDKLSGLQFLKIFHPSQFIIDNIVKFMTSQTKSFKIVLKYCLKVGQHDSLSSRPN